MATDLLAKADDFEELPSERVRHEEQNSFSAFSTAIDTQQSEAIFGELMHYYRTGENGKVLVMQALEHLLKPK